MTCFGSELASVYEHQSPVVCVPCVATSRVHGYPWTTNKSGNHACKKGWRVKTICIMRKMQNEQTAQRNCQQRKQHPASPKNIQTHQQKTQQAPNNTTNNKTTTKPTHPLIHKNTHKNKQDKEQHAANNTNTNSQPKQRTNARHNACIWSTSWFSIMHVLPCCGICWCFVVACSVALFDLLVAGTCMYVCLCVHFRSVYAMI